MASTLGKLVDITFRPGLDRSSTPYASEGTWYDSGRVRFRDGFPETMRGRTTFVVSASTHIGTPRTIMSWAQNDGVANIGMGTEAKLYINQVSTYFDITPVRASTASSLTLSTLVNSREVNVSITSHGLTTGDYVVFTSMAATIGGNVYLSGNEYLVSVSTANIFNFQYGSSATATSTGAGSFNIDYLLPSGTSIDVSTTDLRNWSLSSYGEDLLANPTGGRIYWWDRTNGVNVRAVLVTASPSTNDVMLVSEEARHVLSFGTVDTDNIYQPLLVRWSAANNFNDWTASVGNAAGSLLIQGGSRITGAVLTKSAILVWTDSTLHALDYVGGNFVFRNRKLGDICGLTGLHGMIQANDVVYWMSHSNLFYYDGQVKVLECPIQRDVFSRLNRTHDRKIAGYVDSRFSEIGWLIPTSTSECDNAVIYNFNDKTWWWTPLSYSYLYESHRVEGIIGGLTTTNQLAYHEPPGVFADDGVAYESFVSSANFDLGEGDDIMFMDRYIPDFVFNSTGTVNMTLTAMRYPNLVGNVKGPYTITSTTSKVDFRARGRHAAIRLACSTVNSSWRAGKLRLNMQPDGRR